MKHTPLEVQKTGTFLPFAIVHKASGLAIGCTEFSGIDKTNRKLEIGGKFEGILRNAMILPDGKLRDDAYYSIILSEWPETKERLLQRIRRKSLRST